MEYEIREAIYEHRISFKIEQDPVKKAYYYLKPEQDNLPDKFKNFDISRIVHNMLIEETGESFYYRIPRDKIKGNNETVFDPGASFNDEDLTEIERIIYKKNQAADELYRLPQTGIYWDDILETFKVEIEERKRREGLID
jgi:hypothetical protein